MKNLPAVPFDLKSVLDATARNVATIRGAEDLLADVDEERKRHGLCRCCRYVRGNQGQTVGTSIPCAACGQLLRFGNSRVNFVCLDCSKKHRVCVRCMGDLNDNPRRVRLRYDG